MKGLLLKDVYMAAKYCRSYLLITLIFLTVSFFGSQNTFFLFYPCLLCGMIPVNLLAYDERSRFLSYTGILPITRTQYVSGKYLIGLSAQAATLILTAAAMAIRAILNDTFSPNEFILLIMLVLSVSLAASSLCLPFMFRWGVEKGRIAYYVIIGASCAIGLTVAGNFSESPDMQLSGNAVFPAFAAGLLLYALSWGLSVLLFPRRETD